LEREANRDIYDVDFFFQQLFDINEDLITERTGKPLKEVFLLIKQRLETLPKNYKVLDGLGEVLTEKQKAWVKEHLVNELIRMLEMKIVF
jgi:hypothetical protein